MQVVQQVAFIIALLVSGYLLSRRIRIIRKNIGLGKKTEASGPKGMRWKQVALVAFGQRKMFKRLTPAIFHFFIYVGFMVINLEVLEFIIDGLVGSHRIFAPYLGEAYGVMMNIFEFLAVAVLMACVIFLVRRHVIQLPRFHSPEMTRWPRVDANIILITEIVLMCAILTMNATDQLLQGRDDHYPETGTLFFSSFLLSAFEPLSTQMLIAVERLAWWFHIVGILAFAIYITYSKHLHIFMAFPNTYFARLGERGRIAGMPVVTREVRTMLGMAAPEAAPVEPGTFGAKDVNDLSQHLLLSAYACTECGRCTAECPASQTGKTLSPRKIMMDVRDRMEEVGASGKGLSDGKALLGNYITKEEINACTTCNACVEACPVLINPLEIILELRRYVAMEESGSPAQWNSMFQNIETNFAPWKFSPADRFNWSKNV